MNTIRQASAKLNVSEMYLRKMIAQGKIKTQQVAISEKVWRHEISDDELKAFAARTSQHTSREDGRNKFNVYMTAAEEKKVREALKAAKLDAVAELLVRSNPSKKSEAAPQ